MGGDGPLRAPGEDPPQARAVRAPRTFTGRRSGGFRRRACTGAATNRCNHRGATTFDDADSVPSAPVISNLIR